MQGKTKPPRNLDLSDLFGAIIFGGILLWAIFDDAPNLAPWIVFNGAMFGWCAAGLIVGWMAGTSRAKKLTNLWGGVVTGTAITIAFAPGVLDESGWEFTTSLAALVIGLLILVVSGLKLGEAYPKSNPGERL